MILCFKKNFLLQCMLLFFCVSAQSKNCVDLSEGGIINFLRGFGQALENRYLELKINLSNTSARIVQEVSDKLFESTVSVTDSLEKSTAIVTQELDNSDEIIIDEIKDIQDDLQLDIEDLLAVIIVRNGNKAGPLFDVFNGCPELGNQNVIVNPGYYALRTNLEARVRIEASDVILNLNDFVITADPDSDCGADPIIKIAAGRENIRIANGKLEGFSNLTIDGIDIENGCSGIEIDNVKIFSCQNGIKLNGSSGNEIIGCKVVDSDIKSCETGVSCAHAKACLFESVKALNCNKAGFMLENSQSTVCKACEALHTSNDQTQERAIGFASIDGAANVFTSCVANCTTVESSDFCKSAIGFLLEGQEVGSEIADCIAHSTNASDSPDANAYGIWLNPKESFVDPLVPANQFNHGADILSVKWSACCKFLLIGGNADGAGRNLRVLDQALSPVTFLNNATTVRAVDWAPDGQYVVFGDNTGVRVLLFDGSSFGAAQNLVFNTVNTVAWTPILYQNTGNPLVFSRYFAAGDILGFVRIFEFVPPATINATAQFLFGNDIFSVDWSSSGQFLAVGGASGAATYEVRVYDFDPSIPSFVPVADYSYGNAATEVRSVAWSPNGKYLALGGQPDIAGREVVVLEFSGNSLSEVAIFAQNTPSVRSVSWSPDGKYLAIGSRGTANDNEFKILSFNGSSLTEVASYNPGNNDIFSVSWSPCGRFLAFGGENTIGNNVQSFDVMKEPTSCIVKHNNICNTRGIGIGLSGLGSNVFLNNICFDNDIDIFNVPNAYFYDPNDRDFNAPAFYDNIDFIDQ